jgi:hypothetical protein
MFRTPFLDRYAHQWMWVRGGWDVDPPQDLDPADGPGLVSSTPPPHRHSPRRPLLRRCAAEPPWVVSFVIGLVDPAHRYMQQRHPERGRRRPHRGAWRPSCTEQATVRPRVRDGERASISDETETTRQWRERMAARHAAAMHAAEQRWGGPARVSASELVRDGRTVLQLDNQRQIRGRLVRFWRGDSVLQLQDVGANGEFRGESKTRLRPGQETDGELMAFYLLEQAAQFH